MSEQVSNNLISARQLVVALNPDLAPLRRGFFIPRPLTNPRQFDIMQSGPGWRRKWLRYTPSRFYRLQVLAERR
jgi:hypothetical protein